MIVLAQSRCKQSDGTEVVVQVVILMVQRYCRGSTEVLRFSRGGAEVEV